MYIEWLWCRNCRVVENVPPLLSSSSFVGIKKESQLNVMMLWRASLCIFDAVRLCLLILVWLLFCSSVINIYSDNLCSCKWDSAQLLLLLLKMMAITDQGIFPMWTFLVENRVSFPATRKHCLFGQFALGVPVWAGGMDKGTSRSPFKLNHSVNSAGLH